MLFHKEMSKNQDAEWLKARTIHVKGVVPEDRRGKPNNNNIHR